MKLPPDIIALIQAAPPVPPKTYGIDFDDTFTADPVLKSLFIQAGKLRGHRFYCVTARRATEENEDLLNEWFDKYNCQMPIIFSNLRSKVDEMVARGIKIDVWVDDSPYMLVHGH